MPELTAGEIRQRVVDLLADGRERTLSEIKDRIGLNNSNKISKAIQPIVDRGVITRDQIQQREGRYPTYRKAV